MTNRRLQLAIRILATIVLLAAIVELGVGFWYESVLMFGVAVIHALFAALLWETSK